MPNRNSTGRPVEIIAFSNEIGNSKTFEANLQNSSGRPLESSGHPIEVLQDVLWTKWFGPTYLEKGVIKTNIFLLMYFVGFI